MVHSELLILCLEKTKIFFISKHFVKSVKVSELSFQKVFGDS